MISNRSLWAKLGRDATGAIVRWHSLVDHSADVAAVVEALLAPSTLRQRLAKTANVPDLDETTCARLAALSFLHDRQSEPRLPRPRRPARAADRSYRSGRLDFSW